MAMSRRSTSRGCYTALLAIVWLLPSPGCSWCCPKSIISVRSQRRLPTFTVNENVCTSSLTTTSLSSTAGRNVNSRPYWDEDKSGDRREKKNYYQGDDDYLERDKLEWETCSTEAGTVQILLPPASVDKPTVVLHFVGGTFFGSAPATWYRRLLEDIVRHTQAAVVASSIPVTLLQSPLQHVNLARKIQRQFHTVWREVLLDEYGEEVQTVPVCGLGHSLGARLLVVLETMGAPPDRPLSPPPYGSFVLVSFTNFGAHAGIPGIYQLNKASRRLDRQAREEKEKSRQQRSDKSRRARRDDDWDDWDDYDDDEDWGEIFEDLQKGLKEKADRVRSALTPKSEDLEFHPSPDKLWQALTMDKRYSIPETLVVQFDDDEVDQSSKLTLAVKDSSSVRFARLRGTHLTPISASGHADRSNKSWLEQVNSQAGRSLGKILMGRRHSKSNAESLRQLRQSITSYITEVVTKAKGREGRDRSNSSNRET